MCVCDLAAIGAPENSSTSLRPATKHDNEQPSDACVGSASPYLTIIPSGQRDPEAWRQTAKSKCTEKISNLEVLNTDSLSSPALWEDLHNRSAMKPEYIAVKLQPLKAGKSLDI